MAQAGQAGLSVASWGEIGNAVAMAAPQVADYLRLGTLLMPDGGSTEFTSEAVHTGINIITLAADVATSRQGPLARHRAVSKGGIAPATASEVCLEAARRIELLVEMAAERAYGKDRTIPILALVELFKAACRVRASSQGHDLVQRGRHTGLIKARSFRAVRDPKGDPRLWWWVAGTAVYSLRPVIYLMTLRRCKKGSWVPLLTSLFVDLLSEALATFAGPRGGRLGVGAVVQGPGRDGEGMEKDELQRRRTALLCYFLRPPLFNAVVRPLVALLRRLLGRVPLVGSLVGVVLDMLMSLGRYYFYSAAS